MDKMRMRKLILERRKEDGDDKGQDIGSSIGETHE
jgi:hypothetical protein